MHEVILNNYSLRFGYKNTTNYIYTKIVYAMLKNITFSAEKDLIEKAREKARSEKTTLNVVFRRWLNQYTGKKNVVNEIDRIMESVDYAKARKKFTRDELNER